MPERTHYSVGAYTNEELGQILEHARRKGIAFMPIKGPGKDYLLPDGSKINEIRNNRTAVVLIANDVRCVHGFWDGFEFPKGGK